MNTMKQVIKEQINTTRLISIKYLSMQNIWSSIKILNSITIESVKLLIKDYNTRSLSYLGIFIVCNVKFIILLYSTDKNIPYGVIANCFHALRNFFGSVICWVHT